MKMNLRHRVGAAIITGLRRYVCLWREAEVGEMPNPSFNGISPISLSCTAWLPLKVDG